ncbi:McbB family protein [Enterobacterales bacterium AW_CKDN230030176-1A_HGKHYDSX7]
MNQIKLCNYEILYFDSTPAVFSSTGITKLKSAPLLAVLEQYLPLKNTQVSLEEFTYALESQHLNTEQSLSFLMHIGVTTKATPEPYLQHGVIASDWSLPPSLKTVFTEETAKKLEFFSLDEIRYHQASKPTYYVILCNQAPLEELKKTYFALCTQNAKNAVSLGFLAPSRFHLTEPYFPEIGNPCAFCTLERMAHYQSFRPSNNPWTKLISFCNKKGIATPTPPIDLLSKTLILSTVVRSMKAFLDSHCTRTTQDICLQATTLELKTGFIKRSASIHWPLCDCLGGKA